VADYKPGTLLSIPIFGGRWFVFGRVMTDAFEFFDFVSDEEIPPEHVEQIPRVLIDHASHEDAQRVWKRVGMAPFVEDQTAWAPPRRVEDIVNPERHRVYHKGKIRDATEEEVRDLFLWTISRPDLIVADLENIFRERVGAVSPTVPTPRFRKRKASRPGKPMTADAFWSLIEELRENTADGDAIVEALSERVDGMTKAKRDGFAQFLDGLRRRAYCPELLGAAYVILGGCSDDGFDMFAGRLVTLGREVFESAVANPDSLAGVDDPCSCFEVGGLWALAHRTRLPSIKPDWDLDDPAEVRRRYPRLFAKHLKRPRGSAAPKASKRRGAGPRSRKSKTT
jgi:hypothetical protein